MADALYTVAVVAERLAVSERTVRSLIASGDLAHVRIGRLVRVTDSDLQRFVEGLPGTANGAPDE